MFTTVRVSVVAPARLVVVTLVLVVVVPAALAIGVVGVVAVVAVVAVVVVVVGVVLILVLAPPAAAQPLVLEQHLLGRLGTQVLAALLLVRLPAVHDRLAPGEGGDRVAG